MYTSQRTASSLTSTELQDFTHRVHTCLSQVLISSYLRGASMMALAYFSDYLRRKMSLIE